MRAQAIVLKQLLSMLLIIVERSPNAAQLILEFNLYPVIARIAIVDDKRVLVNAIAQDLLNLFNVAMRGHLASVS